MVAQKKRKIVVVPIRQRIDIKKKKKYETTLRQLNTLSPMNAQDRFTPNNINVISSRQVMRIK